MDWKTSNHMDGSEIRGGIGLQYFAEDGNTSDTGADMDGFNGDAFLESLTGENGLENQQAAAEGEEETVQDGAEDQRTEEQQEEPENQPPEGGEVPPEAVEQPVQTVPLVFNGQQILLPADAVQALTGALGAVLVFRPGFGAELLVVWLGITLLAEGLLSLLTVITAVRIIRHQQKDVIEGTCYEESED